jgi:hypothetical protein
VADELLRTPPAEFIEICRICRSVPLSVLNINSAVNAGAQLARTLGVPVALNYSPWNSLRCPSEYPTPAELTVELTYASKRLAEVKRLLIGASVDAVLLDDERYPNHAVTMLGWRNAMYQTVKTIFPSASVEYYAFMSYTPGATRSGWTEAQPWTGSEKSDARSVSLYKPALLYVQEECYRRTAKAAGNLDVTPWIALGAGYEPAMLTFHEWTTDWDYPMLNDWQLGQEINQPWFATRPERYAPWGQAKHAVFYPPILNQGIPTWTKRFIAYARGATGVASLDGLGVAK